MKSINDALEEYFASECDSCGGDGTFSVGATGAWTYTCEWSYKLSDDPCSAMTDEDCACGNKTDVNCQNPLP